MKAPAVDYVRVRSLEQALSLLRDHGGDASIIAGGQSLVPALNLRLLAPSLLVDIGGLEDLKGVSVKSGSVRIGALTRYVDLERSAEIARHVPLLRKAVAHVAHPAIRNRGTIGGNLAQADPASELPACALALRARMIVAGPEGERSIPAEEFFRGTYETALSPQDVLIAVELPAIQTKERAAFAELVRRSGDYALVGLAAQAVVQDGALSDLRLAYFAIGTKPTLAVNAAGHLIRQSVSETTLARAESTLAEDLEPHDDLHASAATRLHLARVLLRRILSELLPEIRSREPKRKRA